MKANRLFFFLLALTATFTAAAQVPSQIIVANGGIFGGGTLVTVSAWNYATGAYTVFDSFPGGSVQHVLVHGNEAYVCADSTLLHYDLTTYQRRAQAMVPGVRQSAIHGGHLVVTRGYGMAQGDKSVEVRDAQTLNLLQGISGIDGECEGIAVVGDTAYVANPIGFGAAGGNLVVIDLAGMAVARTVALDSAGRQIQDLYVAGDRVVGINTVSFGANAGYVTEVTIPTGAVTTHPVAHGLTQAAGVDGGNLYLELSGVVGTYDIATAAATPSSTWPGGFASMAIDSVNGYIFGTRSDFFTYGRLYRYSLSGTLIDSVEVGISPEAMAVDYDTPTSAATASTHLPAITAFPMPFTDALHLDLGALPAGSYDIALLDIHGRTLRSLRTATAGATLETQGLPAGAYLVRVSGRSGVSVLRCLKTQD